MGQQVMCLIYGCEVPDDLDLWGDNGDADSDDDSEFELSIMEKFEAKFGHDNGPETTPEGGVYLVGYMIAVEHGSNRNGNRPPIPDLARADTPFKTILKSAMFAPSVKEAKKDWDRFSNWVDKECSVSLPDPEVYLSVTEIA